MKSPRPQGTPINNHRRSLWRGRFEGYRFGVTDARLTEWLDQFDDGDKDTAARVLDAVEFISAEQMHAAFRSLLKQLPGWHRQKSKRSGKFIFVAFSRTAGESGDAMLHQFRLATGMNNNYFDQLFVGRSEILREKLGKNDTLVFVDDFVGSGTQAVDAYQRMFQELTAEIGNVFLFTVAAFCRGVDRVNKETRMGLVAHRNLTEKDSISHASCKHFTKQEKECIKRYCERASTEKPWGYGDCGLVLVLSHQCPNNTLAMLQATSESWEPLFPRG